MKITANYRLTAADVQTRTITGQIVPFGVVGNTSAGPTVVNADAISIPDRVVLLVSHDDDRPVGRLTASEVTEDGITASFKVIGTSAGDQALMEAAEGVRDGLSVGLDVTGFDEDGDQITVTAAELREVSLVTFPAFGAARVHQVAAADTTPDPDPEPSGEEEPEGDTVEDTTTPQEEAAPVVAASAPRAHITAEAFPYRPDTGHSMFRDMIAARHDEAAARRVNAAQAMMTAAQKTSDVAQIVPPGYRPDLYVAEDMVPTPFYDAFTKYSISDATPFKIPMFNVSADLIKPHVEGTNPTAGTLSFTETTVSPSAVSGIYDISREALDASNPSLDAIIMRAIREAYATSLENLIATEIIVGATAGTAFPATGKTLAVMGNAASFMATRNLPADRILVNSDTFQALVTEADGSQRPMNPYIGATNADGTVSGAAATLVVGGLPARLAWASSVDLIVARANDAASWTSGLRTWRWEEVAGPANIRFAAFGYVAAHVLRPDGVVTHDAAAARTTTK